MLIKNNKVREIISCSDRTCFHNNDKECQIPMRDMFGEGESCYNYVHKTCFGCPHKEDIMAGFMCSIYKAPAKGQCKGRRKK